MKRFIIVILSVFLLSVFLLSFSRAQAQDANTIVGAWYTQGEKAVVEIFQCDNGYCGRIVWLKEPKNPNGTDKMDIHNPDESKKRCPVVGLTIMQGFDYKGKNKWTGGEIYDPDNGKTYSCNMKCEGNTLKVRGYIGISLIGRTTVWTKKG